MIALANQSNAKWELASTSILSESFYYMNLYLASGHTLNVLKILIFYKVPILHCLRLQNWILFPQKR